MSEICSINSTAYECPLGSGRKDDSVFIESPRNASTLSIPKNCKSINAFSVSSLLKPPQIKWGTASTLYLFMIAAQIPTVPGLFLIETFSRSPFPFSL